MPLVKIVLQKVELEMVFFSKIASFLFSARGYRAAKKGIICFSQIVNMNKRIRDLLSRKGLNFKITSLNIMFKNLSLFCTKIGSD